MQEVTNWQGFENWAPAWDVFIVLAVAAVFVWAVVSMEKRGNDNGT